MGATRIQVLGALRIIGDSGPPCGISPAVHQLLGVLVATGPDGIDRGDLAVELWPDLRPESWKSALRNRIAAARRVLGGDAITSRRGRFRLADRLSVDSWDLIAHDITGFDSATNAFAFLDGEPLVDIEASPLVFGHVEQVRDARAALIQRAMTSDVELSPRALQSLRAYQRMHPLDRTVTCETIRAHVRTGLDHAAREMIAEMRSAVQSPTRNESWVEGLDALLELQPRRRRRGDQRCTTRVEVDRSDDARRGLFAAAAEERSWGVAFELAMSGLPEADRPAGDPARLELLRTIPPEGLERHHRFELAVTLARNLAYVGQEADAFEWVALARTLANSADEQLVADSTGALVGEPTDERRPIRLPASLTDTPPAASSAHSLELALVNHLERCSHREVVSLRERFAERVDASASPYHRWHLMLIESMTRFVDGHLTEAAEAARTAHAYASVFSIVDAETALIGQLSNARQILPTFPVVEDLAATYPTGANTVLGRALQSVARAATDGGEAVDRFLRSFDHGSRARHVIPLVALTAPHARDPELRAALAIRLRRRTGTSAIHGSGLLHLGPVDRIVAKLVPNEAERARHLVASVHVADRQRTRLWQVVCRLDLVEATGATELLRQAEKFACTPELQRIVEERTGAFTH